MEANPESPQMHEEDANEDTKALELEGKEDAKDLADFTAKPYEVSAIQNAPLPIVKFYVTGCLILLLLLAIVANLFVVGWYIWLSLGVRPSLETDFILGAITLTAMIGGGTLLLRLGDWLGSVIIVRNPRALARRRWALFYGISVFSGLGLLFAAMLVTGLLLDMSVKWGFITTIATGAFGGPMVGIWPLFSEDEKWKSEVITQIGRWQGSAPKSL